MRCPVQKNVAFLNGAGPGHVVLFAIIRGQVNRIVFPTQQARKHIRVIATSLDAVIALVLPYRDRSRY
jgi:hypothetical protein